MKLISALIIVCLTTLSLTAQTQKVTFESVQQTLAKGKQYTLAIMKKGPKPEPSDPNVKGKMLMDHLVRLFTLKEEGKLVVFGPVTKEGDYQGIAIFNLTDETEVRKLLEADPFIHDGNLVYELMPWFSIPGFTLPE
ncbi:MAG TPA: YciI family protein [Saprospiraceae bacterium]|nr:YciI family protein [Saprospiraceae bacterium]